MPCLMVENKMMILVMQEEVNADIKIFCSTSFTKTNRTKVLKTVQAALCEKQWFDKLYYII